MTIFQYEHVVIAVELNAIYTNWNCELTNVNGRFLINHSLELDLDIHAPENATHYDANNRRPNILDIILSKNFENQ